MQNTEKQNKQISVLNNISFEAILHSSTGCQGIFLF